MFGSQEANAPVELLLPATFLFVMCYVPSLLSMFSWVRLTETALVVQNPTERWTIPWPAVKRVTGEGGLFIELKGRSEPVHSVAYQGSLIGMLAGWPSSQRAADAIERYRNQSTRPGANNEVVVAFPYRAHILWIGIGWLMFAVLIPLSGRYL